MKIITNSPQETENAAKKLAKSLRPGDIVALIGNLGAGKTVFVRGLASAFGCKKKDIVSPTFVLLRRYKGKKAFLNHFDLYRLKDLSQLAAIGYEEYFFGSDITIIEWADRIKEALPAGYIEVRIGIIGENRRRIKIMSGKG